MAKLNIDPSVLVVGDEITVPAWWQQGKPVRCKIKSVYKHDKPHEAVWYGVTLLPQEGNPHVRFIPFDPARP